MEIVWLGHSCFRLRSRESVVVMDPYGKELGYPLGRPSGDIVTVSHGHPGHSNVPGVAGSPKVVEGPGEYEIGGVFILGVASFHDGVGGNNQGKNTIYLLEAEEMTVCHLGDLGHVPTAEQMEELGRVDVLLIPVGGVTTINAAAATETVSLLEPRVVIPMHYRTEGARGDLDPLDKFLKEMSLKDLEPQDRLSLTRATLPHETRVVVLEHRPSRPSSS